MPADRQHHGPARDRVGDDPALHPEDLAHHRLGEHLTRLAQLSLDGIKARQRLERERSPGVIDPVLFEVDGQGTLQERFRLAVLVLSGIENPQVLDRGADAGMVRTEAFLARYVPGAANP